MTIIVDASVVLKFVLREAFSDQADKLFESDEPLAAPGHFLGEVGEVHLRRFRAEQIDRAQIHSAATLVRGSVSSIPVDDLFDVAIAISSEVAISFYDALYVAAAQSLDTIAVTANARLVARLQATEWRPRVVALAAWNPAGQSLQ